jgi:hypothetical protein
MMAEHTQSQQNTHFAQTDVNRDQLEQNTGRGENARTYENREGAQTGSERSPKHSPGSAHEHNTEPATAAFEGSITSRTFEDGRKQGVTTNASSKEGEGQRKVVGQREDSQAGLNHSSRIPEE